MPRARGLKTLATVQLRRLDFLPSWQAWALGLGFGVLAGAAFAGVAPRMVGVVGFLALLGAAWALAWSGEPVATVESLRRQAPEPDYTSRLVALVTLPGGTFLMGSPETEEGRDTDEGPAYEVRISRFACMRHPVTRRTYVEIVGSDPGWPEGEAVGERPVNNVSWHDAVAFCNQLSEREGLTPCYQIEGEEVAWDRTADGYRLLTEAEWEYACRAGSTTRWSFGDNEEKLGEHAWFGANSNNEPQPVGRKKPNAWGLHDMHGNVYEWCWDWFGPYSAAGAANPSGPSAGDRRVLRGGAFVDPPRFLRSAFRFRGLPTGRDWDVGFRCARGPRRQASPP